MARKKNLKNKAKKRSAGLDLQVMDRLCPNWTWDANSFTACALKAYPNDGERIRAFASVIRLGILEDIMWNGLGDSASDYFERLKPETDKERALYGECLERLNQRYSGWYWKHAEPFDPDELFVQRDFIIENYVVEDFGMHAKGEG